MRPKPCLKGWNKMDTKNYSESCEKSDMELFAKIFNNFRPSTQKVPPFMSD